MPEPVVYELQLRDALSPKVEEAEGHARKLESTLGEIGNKARRMGEAFGIAFASFEVYDFVRNSNEGFEKLEQANAQLRAGLQSTGMAAGVAFADLQASQEKFRNETDFSRASIADMQAQMLTFPDVTKKSFDSASMAILDMATRLHHGLDETAIMVSKALQDPERGLTALRRVGVNFNDAQTASIKRMVESGHAAQAQVAIITELTKEYGGSARAAAEANPFHGSQKSAEDLELDLGGVIKDLKVDLDPILIKITTDFKNTLDWMKQHKDLLHDIGVAVGIAVGAYVGYITINKGVQTVTALTTWYTDLQKAATLSLGVEAEAAGGKIGFLTVMQQGLNAAWKANPIGLVITALTLVTEAVIYCWDHFAMFRAIITATWATIKEFASIVGDVFMGLYHTIHGAINFDVSEIKLGDSQMVNAMYDAAKRLGNAAKQGYNEGLASFAADHHQENHSLTKSAADDTAATKTGGTDNTFKPQKEAATKATGAKNVTINISIKEVVHQIDIKTTTLMQTTAQIRDEITKALTDAVANSTIIAGQM